MVHKYDTDRAVGLLTQYQGTLTRPEEQALKSNVGKVSAIFGSHLFQALLDIQECYEMTLQSNAPENGPKENGTEERAENSTEEEDEEGGVSRVLVTSRRSPQKVERVCGLVSRSHIETPKPKSVDAHMQYVWGGWRSQDDRSSMQSVLSSDGTSMTE